MVYRGGSLILLLQKAENLARNREEKPTGDTHPGKLRGEEKDEDEQLLEEFEEEMADVSVPSEKIEEIKEEMQKEFDNIIDEVSDLHTTGYYYLHITNSSYLKNIYVVILFVW